MLGVMPSPGLNSGSYLGEGARLVPDVSLRVIFLLLWRATWEVPMLAACTRGAASAPSARREAEYIMSLVSVVVL